MNRSKEKKAAWEVRWKREHSTLKLQGEPVVEMELSWPQIVQSGAGSRRINRYYEHLTRQWRERWGRTIYWQACLELARCQREGESFSPWEVFLEGQVLFQDGGTLSIRMDAREIRGTGRPLRVCSGDIWMIPEGVPLPVRTYFPGDRRWWRHLVVKLREQGEARRSVGDCFLDLDFAQKLEQALSPHRCCRIPEGLEFYIPQCALAPAAEGIVTLTAPLPGHSEGT